MSVDFQGHPLVVSRDATPGFLWRVLGGLGALAVHLFFRIGGQVAAGRDPCAVLLLAAALLAAAPAAPGGTWASGGLSP